MLPSWVETYSIGNGYQFAFTLYTHKLGRVYLLKNHRIVWTQKRVKSMWQADDLARAKMKRLMKGDK